MFPPITIRAPDASSAREPISRLSFASSSRTCSAPFFVNMTSVSVCSNSAWLVRIAR